MTHEGGALSGTGRHDYERYYDPPLAAVGAPGEFRSGVVRYLWAFVVLCGGVAASMLGFGLLLMTGVMTGVAPLDRTSPEHRKLGAHLSALGMFLGSGAFLLGAEWVARRGPALRACREGLVVRLIRRSTVDGVPSAPGSFRLGWALLSGRPCRLPMLRIPWAAVAGASVKDKPLRSLVVEWHLEPAGVVYGIRLHQEEIAMPVGKIAAALQAWARDETARESLPSWGDPI